MLVSNHQIVSDLCSFTQDQLRIKSRSVSTESNKRKFIPEPDSDIQLSKYHQETVNECQFDQETNNHNIKVITARITNELATSVTITNTDDSNIGGPNVNNSNISNQTIKPVLNHSNKYLIDNDSNGKLVNDSDELSVSPNKVIKYSSNMQFNRSNLPLCSSPAPLRKNGSLLFDFDNTLKNPRSIRKYVMNL